MSRWRPVPGAASGGAYCLIAGVASRAAARRRRRRCSSRTAVASGPGGFGQAPSLPAEGQRARDHRSSDRDVLVELYDATNGSLWAGPNWSTSAPLSLWDGAAIPEVDAHEYGIRAGMAHPGTKSGRHPPSPLTIRNAVYRIQEKQGVTTKQEIVVRAVRNGLLEHGRARRLRTPVPPSRRPDWASGIAWAAAPSGSGRQ